MKILYISQYFYPEIGATTNRAQANIRYLASKGHQVTVLTEMPNHPKGIIFPEYKGKLFCSEQLDNFMVKRVWVFTSRKKNFITRLLFYLTFVKMTILWLLFNWQNYDVVYVTSPPLFTGIIGLFCKKMHPKTRLVFEIRDLWPDAAIEMGALKNKFMIKYSYSLEKSLYKNSDHLVPVTECFKQKLIKKGVPDSKITVIRNGSDMSDTDLNSSIDLGSKYGIVDKFIVVYAGNLGIAQNLETVLKTAELMQNDDIVFLLIGSGPEETKLKQIREDKKLNNVIFTGEIPKIKVTEYLSVAQCGVIPLKNIEVFKWTIPSKLFDYMAVELPVLLGVKGEAKEILLDSNAGIPFEPDNADDLKEKILYLKKKPELCTEMGKNGRKAIIAKYNRSKLAERLDIVLQKMRLD